MVVCLERGADLHMAQLMALPLTVSCFSKIQIGFTFLVPAHPGSPGQRAVKQVCVCLTVSVTVCLHIFSNRGGNSKQTAWVKSLLCDNVGWVKKWVLSHWMHSSPVLGTEFQTADAECWKPMPRHLPSATVPPVFSVNSSYYFTLEK